MSHWPLTQSVQSMDGFEFALFVLWSIILFLGIGYATDYLLSAKGMGPHWNAACAALGAYLGLCAHDWWFRSLPAYEPELTIYMVLTGLMAALTSASVIAMRR